MTRRPRRLSWGPPPRQPSRRPFRDTAVLYAGFAVVVVIFAAVSGGSLARAVVVAVVFFLAAVGWAAWRRRVHSRDGT